MRRVSRSRPDPMKPMTSYQQFARSDAYALGHLLRETCDVVALLLWFRKTSFDRLQAIEAQLAEDISELIFRTEGQRPAYLRKLAKSHPNSRVPEVTLLLALIGQLRNVALLELRDWYRVGLVPGAGNRVTCQAIYDFGRDTAALFQSYSFPTGLLDECGPSLDWPLREEAAEGP